MIKINIFEQEKSGYCGPASLRMVFDYYGVKLSENHIGKMCGASQTKGTGLLQMINAVKKLGWHGFWKMDGKISDLKYFLKQGKPIIVDWFSIDEGHYSVVADIDKKFIYLADPEFGRINKIANRNFKNIWFDFEGSHISRAKKLHFGWMFVISPDKLRRALKGNYF